MPPRQKRFEVPELTEEESPMPVVPVASSAVTPSARPTRTTAPAFVYERDMSLLLTGRAHTTPFAHLVSDGASSPRSAVQGNLGNTEGLRRKAVMASTTQYGFHGLRNRHPPYRSWKYATCAERQWGKKDPD